MMAELKDGLNAPIAGMATAFSSSLFGLGGSLILGFLDLQLGQAAGLFTQMLKTGCLNQLISKLVDPLFTGAASPEFSAGLTEAAANKM